MFRFEGLPLDNQSATIAYTPSSVLRVSQKFSTEKDNCTGVEKNGVDKIMSSM